MIEDLFKRYEWTKGLVVLRSMVDKIKEDGKKLKDDIPNLTNELMDVDRMLMAIPSENTQTVYRKIVNEKIGYLYDYVENSGVGKWRH